MARAGRLASTRGLALTGAALLAGSVLAAQGGRPAEGIYTCVDDAGRKITSDRPIPECIAKEQRLLNRDGSLRRVVPPTPTADERAEIEARERRAAEARAAQADAVRRDRNLMARYPNEEAHRRAREAALDTVRVAIRASEQRLAMLAAERKPLTEEAEFYPARPLPPKLRQSLDANDAATEAQRTAMANQEAELVRVNRLYDAELERLRRLWAGARPGTLGPMPAEPASAAAR
ncbi:MULTISPECIES: DUF4124 domain-containing protein [Rubrivivax]|uniref:DUF4124 domain-containing protein n=1 Tax=Rubrivivax benzoatilyticus TaxID=316997 RepID=A0ABX0HYT9_9BURK|nr:MULTISPECIES: DUF4124 domain-containing protein [Rubrivivax]MCD0421020.1 DUF4124 domain-containing protein [Rubrivivax sp. JA1024]EGJ10189.1 hypothetical protein RBXJA2T_07668 [Rubrivivax benzoatilyticus JA2 = ATCC BAA-35]MCC9596704.1 DUF4124 domain-containing protein [Rubrivivax sp. JA1055]MCC9648861.1 DUF4124 domain-containing protein [Rubrivivax sp. JA1029]NHK98698.1 DUF4124 domain-containing protein [Rubrivivax benzoatilyticus]